MPSQKASTISILQTPIPLHTTILFYAFKDGRNEDRERCIWRDTSPRREVLGCSNGKISRELSYQPTTGPHATTCN